jgi:hypothetical protein
MSKVLIGNFKGPQGEQGIPGIQGEQGERGNRGSRWTEGTAITGTSTTPTVFSGTGISDALAEDMYLNTDTGNAYRCTTGGVATVAKWVYACNLKGIKGDTGAKGDPGTAGPKGEKGDTGEQGPKGDTPTVADNMTVAFTEAATRENIATGEKMSVLMGKIKKFFTDLTAPAFAQMITTKEDLLATKATGYVPDAKAVADAYTELNGNLTMHSGSITTDYSVRPILYRANSFEAMVYIDGLKNLTKGKTITIATLPEIARPTGNRIVDATSPSGAYVRISVTDSLD